MPSLQFSYPNCLAYVLDAQKNRLIETFLLSNQNIPTKHMFGLRNKGKKLLHTLI